jgi:phenylalanyl-tRNA synthetase alpha subunit
MDANQAQTPMSDEHAWQQSKEVKLQLPLRTHVSLHSIKLLKNQSIRDSVIVALDQYFRDHPVEQIPLLA